MKSNQGTISLILINLIPSWISDGLKLFINCLTWMVAPLKFGNGQEILSHSLLGNAVFCWDPINSPQQDTLMTVPTISLGWLCWKGTSTHLGLQMEGEIPTERFSFHSYGGLRAKYPHMWGQHHGGSCSICREAYNLCITLRWWPKRFAWCCATTLTLCGIYKVTDSLLLLIPKTTSA